ncbi:tyrosine-type recombinase/integrase [Vibrio agarivorans]|uniref:Tyrosine-type recombinase/integrase n=1 Tax=Vibrio agarivorans TaxID=153622 RepID=A0ABT7Y700_9VIBR|nr:tyrosine-type recombinase/integrase [Vibrio agarivorans]MDN2483818.1 tyrosine-type recombinase/integrase [Vibrio agarivorans]
MARKSQSAVFGRAVETSLNDDERNLERHTVTFPQFTLGESFDPDYPKSTEWLEGYNNFLLNRGGLKANTLRVMASTLRGLDSFCAKAGVYTFPTSERVIYEWFSQLQADGQSVNTLAQHKARLSYFFERVVKLPVSMNPAKGDSINELLRTFVADQVERTGEANKDRQALPLRSQHVKAIADMVVGNDSSYRLPMYFRDLTFIVMSYGLSLRYDELRRMRLKQLEVVSRGSRPLVKIHRTTSKTSDSPAPKELQDDYAKVLLEYLDRFHKYSDREDFLFAKIDSKGNFRTPGKPVCKNTCSTSFRRWFSIINPMDVEPTRFTHQAWTAHSARVGSAVDGFELGMTIDELMDVGDWTSRETLMRYLRNSTKKASVNIKLQKDFL